MLNHIIESPTVSPAQFAAELATYAENSRAINHPLLDAIANGEFKDLKGAITRFLQEYYFYSHRFTQYLFAVMSNLELPEHRTQLLPNAMEEGGMLDDEHRRELLAVGINPDDAAAPHPQLYTRFLEAIGLSRAQMQRNRPQVMTAAWIDTFQALCRTGGEAQSVGALGLGTEGIVRHVYLKLMRGISKAWPDLSSRDRAFFDLHAHVDDDHAEVLKNITLQLATTVDGRRGVAIGVLRALAARESFFDQMLAFLRAADGQSQAQAAGKQLQPA